ncbi:hypothetical protein CTZ27_02990 [Streptomyces griseocarneus]|nr:hypothetical protein CTZ27_02990 [Streptomyces griseocarneus]
MSDNSDFENLVERLEQEYRRQQRQELEERAALVLDVVSLTGTVYTMGVASGVPHDLALPMAEHYWLSEMRFLDVTVDEPADDEE